ncbi:hypothetical protein [Thiocystis violascens]|nr:hypothetical protein [Thiocystis violascens]
MRKLFEQATIRSSYPRGRLHRKVWGVSLTDSPETLAPNVAARLFTQPLCICVENRFTDGLFLDAILSVLAPAELKVFLDGCAAKPFRCDSGGGNGELPKIIESRVQEFTATGLPLRAIVFADSDARFPGHISDDAKVIADLCEAHALLCLILSKRAIENYIPDEVLQGWATEPPSQAVRPLVAAICRLTPAQRDHVPMKKKFPGQLDDSQEQALYDDIAPEDLALMQNHRLRNDLIDLLSTHRQHLTADALRNRDGKGELDRLVDMITQSL